MTPGSAQRDGEFSKLLKLKGSRGHVTVDAQNRQKLGTLRRCVSLRESTRSHNSQAHSALNVIFSIYPVTLIFVLY
jgi:hypothetical protein